MAVTGKGAAPVASWWLVAPINKSAKETNKDTALSAIIQDWFFAAAAPPQAGGHNRTLFGVGT